MRRLAPSLVFTLALALAAPGCARRAARTDAALASWTPTSPPDLGTVVAQVAGVPIFAAEVAAQAARTGKAPRAALDDLIAFHLLAERARETEAWPPAAPQRRKEVLVQRLLEREFEPTVRAEDITDAELRVLYERARRVFVHPRLVEVATVEAIPVAGSGAAARAEARETIRALYPLLQPKAARTTDALQALVADPTWQKRNVRYRRFLQGPDGPRSAPFAAAVGRLKAPGDLSGIIEEESGFSIATFLSERPEKNQSFEEMRAELRTGYYPRWRQAKFQAFTDKAAAGHEVEVRQAVGAGASGGSGS